MTRAVLVCDVLARDACHVGPQAQARADSIAYLVTADLVTRLDRILVLRPATSLCTCCAIPGTDIADSLCPHSAISGTEVA
eukprot:2678256-Rhodomonas_salina.2